MVDTEEVLQAAGAVAAATVAVTVAFVGVFALASGDVTDVQSRFPYYVVLLSVAFTAVLLALERYLADGRSILATAVALSIVGTVVVALGVEGVLYALANPNELVTSQLILYLFAAGCLCTGLVYWALNHWREFAATRSL